MIICLVGPTGIGKTRLSIDLAKRLNAIIINGDAMQVYKEMNIGTAKIKENEKSNIPHYLFDICDINEEYSIYNYQKDAREIIEKNKNKNIILVGGSGLYIRAALFDYVFYEESNKNNYEDFTNEELLSLANEKNKEHNIHVNNRQRLIRFLQRDNCRTVEPSLLYKTKFIGLTTNREKLYDLINRRVDKMFEDGLVEEAKSFYDRKINSHAIQTAIGYKELYRCFNNEISLDEAKELIKKNSRHYAKRQYTFFNNQFNIKWFDVNLDNFTETCESVNEYLNRVK